MKSLDIEEVVQVYARCNCGQNKSLGFRTVIHERRIRINKVPIWECEHCGRYEVYSKIKSHLCEVLGQLKSQSGLAGVTFTELNELADVMYEIYKENESAELDADLFTSEMAARCKERINLLLDVYGYAKNNGDREWMEKLMERLSQLTLAPAKAT
ncbi:hypothetical protein [Paenibacillus caui]|uniref:hypothetical protein n=1 Tax=Paenibacillus caui TaxID=2873927 RepID=UPI001CAA15FE|nr:hypothetical protein [Paenibacillus caui]